MRSCMPAWRACPGRAWTAVTGAREAGAARGLVRERRPALAGLHARGRVRARPRLRARVARRAAVHPGRRARALAAAPARGGVLRALLVKWHGSRTPVTPAFIHAPGSIPLWYSHRRGKSVFSLCFWYGAGHAARPGPPAALHAAHDNIICAGQGCHVPPVRLALCLHALDTVKALYLLQRRARDHGASHAESDCRWRRRELVRSRRLVVPERPVQATRTASRNAGRCYNARRRWPPARRPRPSALYGVPSGRAGAPQVRRSAGLSGLHEPGRRSGSSATGSSRASPGR